MSIFVHPSAVVDEGANIGDGTSIWHYCHIMQGANIGKDVVLGQNVFVAGGAKVGNRVHVQNNVSVFTGVILEDDSFVGPSAVFTNVRNPRSMIDRKKEYKNTYVGRGATIGANAVIVAPCYIGEYALVGAGTVVNKNIPAYTAVVGNPCRELYKVCSCGEKLIITGSEAVCRCCGNVYSINKYGEIRYRDIVS